MKVQKRNIYTISLEQNEINDLEEALDLAIDTYTHKFTKEQNSDNSKLMKSWNNMKAIIEKNI